MKIARKEIGEDYFICAECERRKNEAQREIDQELKVAIGHAILDIWYSGISDSHEFAFSAAENILKKFNVSKLSASAVSDKGGENGNS